MKLTIPTAMSAKANKIIRCAFQSKICVCIRMSRLSVW